MFGATPSNPLAGGPGGAIIGGRIMGGAIGGLIPPTPGLIGGLIPGKPGLLNDGGGPCGLCY